MHFIEFTFFNSVGQLLTVAVLVLFAQFIYSAIGFGSGMIAISIYAILYGQIDVFVPFFLLLCFPVELFISYKERKKIDYKEIFWLSLFVTPPLILGVYLLKNFSGNGIVYLLGIIIAVLAVFYLFFEERLRFTFKSKLWLPMFGAISGILGSLFGIAGPPLIIYFKTKRVNKSYFRVILMSIFLLMSVLRIISYSCFGLFTERMFISLLPIMPFSLLGLFLGNMAHHKISESFFKKLTSIVLLISGVILIFKG